MLLSVTLVAQDFEISNFSARNTSNQSQIFSILEDSQHNLWIGTQGGGLLRYDGQFNTISLGEKGNPSVVKKIVQTQNGMIWVLTEKRLFRTVGRGFSEIASQPGDCICRYDSSSVFLINNKTVSIARDLDKNDFIALPKTPDRKIYDCLTDQSGQIWIATNQGVLTISQDKEINLLTTEEGLTSRDVRSVLEDRSGQIWLGTHRSGISKITGDSIIRFEYSDPIEEAGALNVMYEDRSGNLLFGTEQSGLLIWNRNQKKFTRVDSRDGLESNDVKAIIQDSWNNYWIGTAGGGLSKLTAQQLPFKAITQSDGFEASSVYSIFKDNKGLTWLSTSDGLQIFDKGEFTNLTERYGWTNFPVYQMLEDEAGRIWAGTVGKGLIVIEDNQLLNIDRAGGLSSNRVTSMVKDSLGNIWVGTANRGITKFSEIEKDSTGLDYRFEVFDYEEKWPDYISDLYVDQEQRLWIASATGQLGYVSDTTYQEVKWSIGLTKVKVNILVEDDDGYLWGGTERNGIFKLNIYDDSLQFRFIDRRDGLTAGRVSTLSFDERGLWSGNGSGVDHILFDENGNLETIDFYGSKDGFISGRMGKQAILITDQYKWFGTRNGLMRYRGTVDESIRSKPFLQLQEIIVGDTSLSLALQNRFAMATREPDQRMQLTHQVNDLSFRLQAIDYRYPEGLRYQWTLGGRFDDWLPLTTEQQTTFRNLPPGDYTFVARAYQSLSDQYSDPVFFHFKIIPPIWERLWFKLMLMAIGILIIAFFFNRRVRAVERKARVEAEKLNLEKKLLQLEQKALQLQMNPHFIFNALNTIQGQINEKEHRTARYQLAKFSKLMRLTLENSRATFILLEDEVLTLENYLKLERASRNNHFDFEIIVDPDINPELDKIAPMMIQPFVENAIIHGVAHRPEGGKITVQFKKTRGMMQCTVEDNGIGRAAAEKLNSQQSEYHKSVALQVTRERLSLLSGGQQSSLQISDIKDDTGNIEGTKVLIRLPYRK